MVPSRRIGWGCSPELQEFIRSIKMALQRRFGKIPGPHEAHLSERLAPRPSRPVQEFFDEGHIAPAGFLSPAVEIVHIPQVATLVLVAVSLSESTQVPVGFASVEPGPLSNVAQLAQVDARFDELWRGERREEEELIAVEPDVEEIGDT